MTPVTLPAHFDGQQILLDSPYPLEPETRLLVVVLPDEEAEDERADWLRVSAYGLSWAYGDGEPDYSTVMVKEPNPEYEPRP